MLLPAGHERLATVVPAWRRGRGLGPAAEALARLIAGRGVPVPAVLIAAGLGRGLRCVWLLLIGPQDPGAAS